MKHTHFLVIILTACSGGDFNARQLDSGSVLDGGSDVRQHGDSGTSMGGALDAPLQRGGTGGAQRSVHVDADTAGHDAGTGGRSNSGDSDASRTGGQAGALPAVESDAGSSLGTGGTRACGIQLGYCPCCTGYTCTLGRCL